MKNLPVWKLLSDQVPSNENLIEIILKNRQINDIKAFINPKPPRDFATTDSTLEALIRDNISTAVKRLFKAISDGRPIVIHGDYDVDGQTSTAILWRTLYEDINYKNTYPYIPNRFDEGYGLTKASLDAIKSILELKYYDLKTSRPLIITVDCGITAIEETILGKNMGFEIIITDHHKPKETFPDADVLVWTDKPTGAGISWLISQSLLIEINKADANKYLDLACLGTICDLQPLTGFNRSVVKYGLLEINKSQNKGINALKNIAGITNQIDTYEVGWVLGPRLNASGRLETAMNSLRLLSTNSSNQAVEIASSLNEINKTRQDKTFNDYNMASKLLENLDEQDMPNFIVSESNEYHDGIIGLMAAKLAQGYNRPAIVISIEEGSDVAKGSGRSIKGVSIIDILKNLASEDKDLFINFGGHDMACGFSIKINKIPDLKAKLANFYINKSVFNKVIEIDLELKQELISLDTYKKLSELKPFGTGNSEPIFLTKKLQVLNVDFFGKTLNHVKFGFSFGSMTIKGVAFNFAEKVVDIHPNSIVDVVYQLSNNLYNGQNNFELKVRDIRLSD